MLIQSLAPYEGIISFVECKAKVEASSQARLMAERRWPGDLNYSQKAPTTNHRAALRAYFRLGRVVEALLKEKVDVDSKRWAWPDAALVGRWEWA